MKKTLYLLMLASACSLASCDSVDEERAENAEETVEEMEDEAEERTDEMEDLEEELPDTSAVIE